MSKAWECRFQLVGVGADGAGGGGWELAVSSAQRLSLPGTPQIRLQVRATDSQQRAHARRWQLAGTNEAIHRLAAHAELVRNLCWREEHLRKQSQARVDFALLRLLF